MKLTASRSLDTLKFIITHISQIQTHPDIALQQFPSLGYGENQLLQIVNYPFTLPAVNPCTKNFWQETNTIRIGTKLSTERANTYPHCVN